MAPMDPLDLPLVFSAKYMTVYTHNSLIERLFFSAQALARSYYTCQGLIAVGKSLHCQCVHIKLYNRVYMDINLIPI